MTISRINTPEFPNPLTKIWDYLPDKDKRVFNAVSKVFQHVFLSYSLNKIFTPDLCGEPASSPHLFGVHRQIAQSIHTQPPLSMTLQIKFKELTKKVTIYQLTPNGKSLIAASKDKISMYDLKTRTYMHTLTGHTDNINNILLTPDGKRLIAEFNSDPIIKIWDLETDTCIHDLRGHTGKIFPIILAPDGERLFSASASTIKIWDIKKGTCMQTLPKLSSYVTNMTLTPNGEELIWTCCVIITIWDLKKTDTFASLKGIWKPSRALQSLQMERASFRDQRTKQSRSGISIQAHALVLLQAIRT